MDQVNRRSALAMGAAAVAGLATIPFTSTPAHAEEHRNRRLHDAAVALRVARDEIASAPHTWGGQKREALESIDRALVHLERLRDWHE